MLCKRLEILDVSHNSISSLDGVGCLTGLEALAIDANPIKALLVLRPLSVLAQLHTLSLTETPVASKTGPTQLRVLLRNIVPGKH